MAKNSRTMRVEEKTLQRLKKIKPLIEVEEDVYFENFSDVVDYLIAYRRDCGFTISKKKF